MTQEQHEHGARLLRNIKKLQDELMKWEDSNVTQVSKLAIDGPGIGEYWIIGDTVDFKPLQNAMITKLNAEIKKLAEEFRAL